MNNINKNYFITFGVSLLVMIAIAVTVFMLMLPKQSAITKGVVQDYQSISKSEYTFEATKAISSEPLKKQYNIPSLEFNNVLSTLVSKEEPRKIAAIHTEYMQICRLWRNGSYEELTPVVHG